MNPHPRNGTHLAATLIALLGIALALPLLGLSPLAAQPRDNAAADNSHADNGASENAAPDQPEELSAREILDHIDDLHRANSSHGKMKMEIKKENWERSLTMEYWSKGKKQSMFRILEPARERGMGTLRNDNEIWNYLPRTNRTIRLNSAMMGDSWAGSHFTNNDLVKDSRMADDYTFEVTFRGMKQGYDIIEITCMPTEDAAVEWGKVRVVVRRADYIPMFGVYYDEDMKEARFMTYHEVKEIGGRTVPSVMRVIPADKRSESTTITILEAAYNIDLADDVFTLRNLQKD